MTEEEAGMTRWTAEHSVKCEGEWETEMADGVGVRVEGGVESQWSMQPPLRGKIGIGWSCSALEDEM
jgi:cellulase/cellobiase CelA1